MSHAHSNVFWGFFYTTLYNSSLQRLLCELPQRAWHLDLHGVWPWLLSKETCLRNTDTYVCSDHFVKDDYKQWTPVRKTVKPNFVSSVFQWKQPPIVRSRKALSTWPSLNTVCRFMNCDGHSTKWRSVSCYSWKKSASAEQAQHCSKPS